MSVCGHDLLRVCVCMYTHLVCLYWGWGAELAAGGWERRGEGGVSLRRWVKESWEERGSFLGFGWVGIWGECLPAFEGCSVDTIMVVAGGPETKDWDEAEGETSVPWGVVITSPAERERQTVTWRARSMALCDITSSTTNRHMPKGSNTPTRPHTWCGRRKYAHLRLAEFSQ